MDLDFWDCLGRESLKLIQDILVSFRLVLD